MSSFLEKVSCTIVAGGYRPGDSVVTVEVIFGGLRTKQLPNLPEKTWELSMVYYDGAILLCGDTDNLRKCLQLDHGTWKKHSTLNEKRNHHSVITTKTGIFLFGGKLLRSRRTYEFLPKGSRTWIMGKTEIPGGFDCGCAIAVKSDQEIWLIGGFGTERRILSFHVNDHTFEELPFQLSIGRRGHRCAFIPNTKKVMVTGGKDVNSFNTSRDTSSTEILDTEDGSVTMGCNLKSKRTGHGMGVLTINGEDRLAVFGGYNHC